MDDRLRRELDLALGRYPDLQFVEAGQWIHLPAYKTGCDGWDRPSYSICFQLRQPFPDVSPYGIHVSPRPRHTNGQPLTNCVDAPDPRPPFAGEWCRFSWEVDGWRATPDIESGHNILNYIETFRNRFAEGP